MNIRRVLCLCILALAGCSSAKPVPPSAPPEVGVVTLHAQPVTITTDLPGRTVAYRIGEVRPQVSGVILRRLFNRRATDQHGSKTCRSTAAV
jgi:membrane fusion protein (multidrug efflux system)